MTNVGGARAWQYLRRNPGYVEAWRKAGPPAPDEPAPFPLRAQTEADCEAANWGLLAWEDPTADDGPSSPFWTDAPTFDAVQAPEAPAISELLKAPDVRLSGLRTEGGAVILKAEKGDASVQLRIGDGEAFDPDGGLDVRLPVTLDLKVRLRAMADLWPIGAAPPTKSPVEGA